MKNFEVVANFSSFDKWSLDRLVNGFLNNDGNLPAWAVGNICKISPLLPRGGGGGSAVPAGSRS